MTQMTLPQIAAQLANLSAQLNALTSTTAPVPGPAVKLVPTPGELTLKPGETATVTVVAYDANDLVVP